MFLQLVEVFFAFLLNHAVSSLQPRIKAIREDLLEHFDELAGHLEAEFAEVTSENIQKVIDRIFGWMEDKLGNGIASSLIKTVLVEINQAVDHAGLPAILAWLKSHGIVIN